MTKQEKIQEAYGDLWENVKDKVSLIDGFCENELFQDDDGDIIVCPSCSHIFHESKKVYCVNSLERCPQCNGHVSQYEYHYKFVNIPEDSQKRFGQWRPKSLQGIETNHGWIKIESEDDLPKERVDIYYIDKRLGGIIETTTFYVFEAEVNNETQRKHMLEFYSHYQPIIKSQPPIY